MHMVARLTKISKADLYFRLAPLREPPLTARAPSQTDEAFILDTRDGNSSLRLGLESHLSRINKDLGLDLGLVNS